MRKKFVPLGLVSMFLFSALFGTRAQSTHDVAIVSVTPTCPFKGLPIVTEAYCTWTINVSVIVRNEGDFSEIFNVTAYYDNNTIGTKNVTLGPGENTTLTFPWKPPPSGYWWWMSPWPPQGPVYYGMSANASVVLGETATEDNTYIDGTVKIKIWGDASNDDFVDVDDLQFVGWNWQQSARGKSAQCDFNFDCFVDIDDLQMMGWHWHKP